MSACRSQDGVTLVELIIAVAVVAVLSAIAYPLYTSQVLKSHRADAKVALHAIAMAQERFYTANGVYTVNLGSLNIASDLQGGSSENGYFSLGLSVADAGQTFTTTAAATASQAADDCDNFTLNYLGVKTNSGPASCW